MKNQNMISPHGTIREKMETHKLAPIKCFHRVEITNRVQKIEWPYFEHVGTGQFEIREVPCSEICK